MTPTASSTISTVAMISPQGVCRWLTIFLDWARLGAGRAWPLLRATLPAAVLPAAVLPVAVFPAAVLPAAVLPAAVLLAAVGGAVVGLGFLLLSPASRT